MASLDSQLHIANARLNETHAEVRSLMSKQSLLQNRVQELEQLLEAMRAQHFSHSQSKMIGGPEASNQVRTLQVRTLAGQTVRCSLCACARLHMVVAVADELVSLAAPCRRKRSCWKPKRET